MYAKWIPAIEIILKEAGEWNGWSLGSSRRNIDSFQYITKVASAEKHGGCNTTCTTCKVSLCISTCTAWAEELAMLWLHGVDNKVHVTWQPEKQGRIQDFQIEGAQKFQHVHAAHIPAANRLASHRLAVARVSQKWLRVYRAIGVRLLAVTLRLLLP